MNLVGNSSSGVIGPEKGALPATATAPACLNPLIWERVMSETRYGRYADRIESQAVAFALSRCPAPGVLLDIGCEGGRRSQLFGDLAWQIIATDVDAESLHACKSRIPNARCVLADSNTCRLPADTDSVDVALCVEVSPVIHSDWAVAEFARVLKRGGWLVGVCWNRGSWRGFLFNNVGVLRKRGSLSLFYSKAYSEFHRQMTDHGFQFEKEVGYAWGPFRRTSNSPLVDVWAAFERISGLQLLPRAAPMIAFVARKL